MTAEQSTTPAVNWGAGRPTGRCAMNPVEGQIYLLRPFVMHDGSKHPGGIHVRVTRYTAGRGTCIAQHMKAGDGGWVPGMSASVPIDALRPVPPDAEVPRDAELTPRHLAVLQLTARGDGLLQIAAKLEVTEDTVKSHRRAIMRRLGARTTAEAVAIAYQRGLLVAPLVHRCKACGYGEAPARGAAA